MVASIVTVNIAPALTDSGIGYRPQRDGEGIPIRVGINLPVKLIALAEGALTGFTDEIFTIPQVVAARELFIDVPGAEAELLAQLAHHYDTCIVASQTGAGWPIVY